MGVSLMPQTFRLRLLLSVAGLLLFASSSFAQTPQPGFADPILGRWDITVQGPDGPYPSWVEITLRKETEVMGRFVGRFGSTRYLAQVEYNNGDLVFRVPVQYEQNTSDMVFKGKLAGDKLSGTTEDVGGKTLNWTGVRAPQSKPTMSAKWGKSIELFNGKDLTGWKLRSNEKGNCWNVASGTFTNTVPCVDLLTERKFGDFKLHAEFNYVEKATAAFTCAGATKYRFRMIWVRPMTVCGWEACTGI